MIGLAETLTQVVQIPVISLKLAQMTWLKILTTKAGALWALGTVQFPKMGMKWALVSPTYPIQALVTSSAQVQVTRALSVQSTYRTWIKVWERSLKFVKFDENSNIKQLVSNLSATYQTSLLKENINFQVKSHQKDIYITIYE